MQQIMWETTFNEQFEKILESYGIDKSDKIIDSLRLHLNFSRRKSCNLLIEVDEDWKTQLARVLENELCEDPECE